MSIMIFGSNKEKLQVPMICEPLASQPIAFCQRSYEHLSRLDLADSSDRSSRLEVDVLVGSDQYWDLTTGRIHWGMSGTVAIETKWVLFGPNLAPTQGQASPGLITHTLRVDTLPQDVIPSDRPLKSFWELESFGVPESDHSVYDKFQETVQFKNGR